jgi:predicted outer membrane repeat protein
VVSAADSGPGTLREALERAEAGFGGTIFIDLRGDKLITLASPLPKITQTLTIQGNGATLTQSGMAPAAESQLLYIDDPAAMVKISRLHFKGARTAGLGGAIHNKGDLTLESCIFSDNQQTSMTTPNGGGGIYTSGAVTLLGCTFYNNYGGYTGGVIVRGDSGTLYLTGNLFYGNTATSYPITPPPKTGTVSGGYNVADQSNAYNVYDGASGDVFGVAALPLSPLSFRPIAGGAAATALTGLSGAYPAADFYGAPIAAGGAAGAVQATATGFYLEYSVNNDAYGAVSRDPAPDQDGLYASGQSVTLTATVTTGIPGVSFSHWTVNGDAASVSNPYAFAMDTHKTVRAVFVRDWVVNDPSDTAGSEAGITLRYALTNAGDGDTVTLPAGATINLTGELPQITKSIVIAGNGATVTRDPSVPALNTFGFLSVRYGATVVTISRLHFKGARATSFGGAIANSGNLTLESCVFSDNQVTGANGGVLYTDTESSFDHPSITVLSCTFYDNRANRGGAISVGSNATLALTGNLFYGNTAAVAGNVVYNGSGNVASGGYNVSDFATGTDALTGSGYSSNTGDVFNVATLPLSPATFKPLAGGAAAGRFVPSLPANYPALDFYGESIAVGGAAGAVQALVPAGGYSLDYGAQGSYYGTVSPSPPPDENGFYSSGQSITLTASTPAPGVSFSHWTISGEADSAEYPLVLAMTTHKNVRAVFTRNWLVNTVEDIEGSAETISLRYALANAPNGDTVTLPAGATIRLTAPLPEILRSIVIAGNSATLTCAPSMTSNLLVINSVTATVKISRLHFRGVRTTSDGGAIYSIGNLTLESCIFSDNQATVNAVGGAVLSTGGLTVLGCTFYNNLSNSEAGAISGGRSLHPELGKGPVSLTGNLFYGNIAPSGSVAYGGTTITSGGYNVSDKAAGTNAATGSGYTSSSGDVFDIAALPLSPMNFKPLAGDAAATALTARPTAYPLTDFYGQATTAGGAAGAVQATATGGFYLDYGVTNDAYGAVTPNPPPDADGFYAPSQSVTLTAAVTAPGIAFSYWLVDGEADDSPNPLVLSMTAHKTVRAVLGVNYEVNDTGDTDGSAETVTLRYALANAADGDTVTLPQGATIRLATPLPEIVNNITIAGNGATLTQSGFTPTATSQLLRINNAAAGVKIRRLHFKGGRSSNTGAAIRYVGNLALESCIFSDNQGSGGGGAIGCTNAVTNKLTVRGCTFYNNTARSGGGAMTISGGTAVLTGNLFFGNTSASSSYGNVVNTNGSAIVTSGGYNISDKAAGTNATTGSGYADSNSGDVFNVTALPLGPVSFRPILGGAAATALTARPAYYPLTDFYGQDITAVGAAGAVQALAQGNYFLDYATNNDAYGTVSPSPATAELYSANQSVELTATATTDIPDVSFSHWTISGAPDSVANPLTLVMDAHKTVRAVFGRNWQVNTTDDNVGSAETITLRYALTIAIDDDTIILPENGIISLTEALPDIAKSITIAGNGATLTRAGTYTTSSATSQFLRIGSATTVKISRLHLKGGRASEGAAIRNTGNLVLESCVFSDNQGSTNGGAVYTTGTSTSLTVLGCTFYNNRAAYGGAIFRNSGTTISLTGNLFSGNTATNNYAHVVYGDTTSGGYNVSDKAAGVDNTTGSGYTQETGDLFDVTDINFATPGDPTTKPASSGSNLKTLTTLPEGFPAAYFDGTARNTPATAGAVSAD